jgi:ribosome maturation factor RimP
MFEPAVRALGYELVGVEHLVGKRRSLVRVYIDSEAGIALQDCERVSRQLSGILDVEDPLRGTYTLEVSSPGLDRPLYTLEHYARFMGQLVRVELKQPVAGRRRFVGQLAAVEAGDVRITEDGRDYSIPFVMIHKARLVPEVPPVRRGRTV